MIKAEARYYNMAHRLSDLELDSSVTELHDGQWLMQNGSGKWVISDGTKPSFITLSAKYGNPVNNIGQPITAAPTGWDNVTLTGRVSILVGPFRLETDQFVTGTSYAIGDRLKVVANGKLDKWVSGTDGAEKVVAVVCKAPANAQDTIGFIAK